MDGAIQSLLQMKEELLKFKYLKKEHKGTHWLYYYRPKAGSKTGEREFIKELAPGERKFKIGQRVSTPYGKVKGKIVGRAGKLEVNGVYQIQVAEAERETGLKAGDIVSYSKHSLTPIMEKVVVEEERKKVMYPKRHVMHGSAMMLSEAKKSNYEQLVEDLLDEKISFKEAVKKVDNPGKLLSMLRKKKNDLRAKE